LKKSIKPTSIYPWYTKQENPISLDDEDTHPIEKNFKIDKRPKAKGRALLRTPSPEPSHKENNDPIELYLLLEG
jgi:hypothetical protein